MRTSPLAPRTWTNWALAVAVLLATTGLNVVLQPAVDLKLPWLVYFPALVLTGLVAGLGPALLLLVGALLIGMTFWIEPYGRLWPVTRTADLISSLMFLLGGGCVVAVGAWTRKLLRQARNDQLRLDIALSTGHMSAWGWNPKTDEIRFTANAANLFGTVWSHGRQTYAVAHPDDRGRIAQAVEKALQSESDYDFLSRMCRADTGEVRWIQTRGHVHRDDHGKAIFVSGVTADVTDLVLAEEKVREESQRKDAFLATLAHELRNPLAPIRYAAALLGESATPAQRQRARDVIDRQSAHMARLLDDLLDISRITRDVIELKLEVLDLRKAVEHAAENARTALSERSQTFQVLLPAEPILIKADMTRIQQVLGNVLDNARKYTPPGGQISLRLERQQGQALVHVRDNGVGIAPEDQQRIFDLFAQVDKSGRSPGLGIGLALVRRLLRLHGGTIEVHSGGVGRGTEFTISLPISHEDRHHPPFGADAPPVHAFDGNLCVLVVDDNVDTAETLAAVLRGAGLAVRTAHSGRAALAAFDDSEPAAVVLDLDLPDLSGVEVAREIRRRGPPGIPLIAVTGWGRFQEEAQDVGFDMHLVKPVDPGELQASLANVLATHGQRASIEADR